MKGSIFKRANKKGKPSWRLQVSGGFDAEGKRIRISKVFPTKGEAETELNRIISAASKGRPITAESITFGEYLDGWLDGHVAGLTYYTAKRYKSLLQHVRGDLGNIKLGELTATGLERVYTGLYSTLSARTVRNVHGAVSSALNDAVRKKLLPYNPAAGCNLRPSDTAESVAIETPDIERLESATAGTWLGIVVKLGADTGLRRGELCGLRWADLNFQTGQLRIARAVFQRDDGSVQEKPTKTRQIRQIALSPSTLAYLEMHRTEQRQIASMMGSGYRRDLDLILAGVDGDYLKPQSITNCLRRVTTSLGLKKVNIHTLRHSHGSILLGRGASLAVVSRRLGHSSPYTTAKIYAHSLPSDEQAAAALWDKIRSEDGTAKTQPGPVAPNGTAESEKDTVQ